MYPRIVIAKIGWGIDYHGEELTGNFKEPNSSGSWFERFNLQLVPDDRYYGYIYSTYRQHRGTAEVGGQGWVVDLVHRSTCGRATLAGWMVREC